MAEQKRVMDEIGKKMVSGWKMLSRHCPICTTVLMQNKVGMIWCCSCQMWASGDPSASGAAAESTTSVSHSFSVSTSTYSSSSSSSSPSSSASPAANATTTPADAQKFGSYGVTTTKTATAETASAAVLDDDAYFQKSTSDEAKTTLQALWQQARSSYTDYTLSTAAAGSGTATSATVAKEKDDEEKSTGVDMEEEDFYARLLRMNMDSSVDMLTPEEQARALKRDTASKAMSEKMLQGWAMLAEGCLDEQCNTPLMRDRQGVSHCLECTRTYKVNEGIVVPFASEVSAAASSTSSPSASSSSESHAIAVTSARGGAFSSSAHRTKVRESADEEDEDDEDWYTDDFDRSKEATPNTNAPNGKAKTNTCTSMSTSSSSPPYHAVDEVDEYGELTMEATGALLQKLRREDDDARFRRGKGAQGHTTSTISALIAEHMSKGWKILSIYCSVPKCQTPLMEDNVSGRLHCVACGAKYMSDKKWTEYIDKQKKSASSSTSSSSFSSFSSLGSPAATSRTAVSASTSAAPVAPEHLRPRPSTHGYVQQAVQATPSSFSSSSQTSPSSFSSSSSAISRFDAVETSLLRKLEACGRELELSTDMPHCQDVAALMRSVMQTMQELNALKASY